MKRRAPKTKKAAKAPKTSRGPAAMGFTPEMLMGQPLPQEPTKRPKRKK